MCIFKSKFKGDDEIIYRNKFSEFRYKAFLFLEKIYKKYIDAKDQRLQIIVDNINKAKPKRILEIGSGTFPIYSYLPNKLKQNIHYYICEVNKKKVDYLKKNYKKINVDCSEAVHLPYKNNFFDFVFSKGVLHHIDSIDAKEREKIRLDFLLESKRVLKDGGSNLLMDFSYEKRRLSDIIWHFLHKVFLYEGEHNFYSMKVTKSLFKTANYKDITGNEFVTYKGFYYYLIAKK
ncbi:MAG: class I SAM-dependent methyltransferase [Patescibacteria group bacterium]